MKPIGKLHVLTDTVLQNRFSHLDLARLAIAGGADTIQYRQKTGTAREMIATATSLRALCEKAGIPLIVNDRVDIAIASSAHGVHLGQDDFPVRLARQLLGPEPIIGVSTGSLEEAQQGIAEGANYVGFGPIYPTGSKSDAGEAQGLENLTHLAHTLNAPVIAIGGIGETNAADVIRAGAHGIAVISAICCKENPEAAARGLLDRIRSAKAT